MTIRSLGRQPGTLGWIPGQVGAGLILASDTAQESPKIAQSTSRDSENDTGTPGACD